MIFSCLKVGFKSLSDSLWDSLNFWYTFSIGRRNQFFGRVRIRDCCQDDDDDGYIRDRMVWRCWLVIYW